MEIMAVTEAAKNEYIKENISILDCKVIYYWNTKMDAGNISNSIWTHLPFRASSCWYDHPQGHLWNQS